MGRQVRSHIKALIFPTCSVNLVKTGSVLVSRLSTVLPQCTFFVIEAGTSGDPRIEPTQGYFQEMDPNIEWDHRSVPQKGMNGKIVGQSQGKILGGSSAINVQGWTRGPSDL